MNPNEILINQFYTAFQNHDYKGMQACYHQDIEFKDNAFSDLKGSRVKAMWHMLISGSSKENPIQIFFGNIKANEHEGIAEWEASYLFSLTGRKVHNIINAKFLFKDGKIIQHHDHFDFWKWSKMAFGTTGYMLGWTDFFMQKVQKTALERLDKFVSKNPEYLK